MRQIFFTVIAATALLTSCNNTSAPRFLKADPIVVCGDNKILIIDLNQITADTTEIQWVNKNTDHRILWAYKNDSPEFLPFDECKPRDNWHTILVTSSKEAAAVLNTDTGELEFNAFAPMAHSIERLPGGRIAAVMSTREGGNRISIYDPDNDKTPIIVDSMYSGHGAVWMKERKRFYTLNYDQLREYKLVRWTSKNPCIEQVRAWHVPAIGGHDLVRVDADRFLVTDHEGTYVFDLKTEEFTIFEPLQEYKNVKSVNWYPEENLLIYTKGEVSWWTHHIYILNTDSGREQVITIPDVDLYKVRR